MIFNHLTRQSRDSKLRSVIKTFTWRFTGSANGFLITLFITGYLEVAGAIASIEIITGLILYYLHERGWSHVDRLIDRKEKEWSGTPCPNDPDNFWIDDKTGERIVAQASTSTVPGQVTYREGIE